MWPGALRGRQPRRTRAALVHESPPHSVAARSLCRTAPRDGRETRWHCRALTNRSHALNEFVSRCRSSGRLSGLSGGLGSWWCVVGYSQSRLLIRQDLFPTQPAPPPGAALTVLQTQQTRTPEGTDVRGQCGRMGARASVSGPPPQPGAGVRCRRPLHVPPMPGQNCAQREHDEDRTQPREVVRTQRSSVWGDQMGGG
jgi:hypothetical protein